MQLSATFLILLCMTTVPAFASDKQNDVGRMKFSAFKTMDKSRFEVIGEPLTLKNMPQARSQGDSGFCYAFVAAAMIDYANCQATGQTCAALTDDQKASPLDLSRYGQEPEHRDIRASFKGIKEGGWTSLTLDNALATRRIAKESCSPYSQIAYGVADNNVYNFSNFNKYRKEYEKIKKLNLEDCKDCNKEAKRMKSQFGLVSSVRDIIKSFSCDSYELFMDKLLIPNECGERKKVLKLWGDWTTNNYPNKDAFSEYSSKEEKNHLIIEKIKSVLRDYRTPVSADFCADEPFEEKKKCSNGHAVLIYGYRKACNIIKNSHCKIYFHVLNSWGKEWQDDNDDGWVEADEIVRRTYYEKYSFSWIVNKSQLTEN